ncbi:hypothetical protein VTJ04DRAFT_1439 [Mycothermus thermophilus]|uniref:uncharacterized protein n=1 Tax=Humicola insolens TaxID=85995 RepID=UPI003742C237
MSFQTPGGPAAKRRRIEAANLTLRKPFRSPLINRQPTTESSSQTLQQNHHHQQAGTGRAAPSGTRAIRAPSTPASIGRTNAESTPEALSAGGEETSPPFSRTEVDGGSLTHKPSQSRLVKSSSSSSLKSAPGLTKGSLNKPACTSTSTSTGTGTGATDHDPTNLPNLIHQIQASQKRLQTQLRAAQQRLELVRQARRIEEASKPAADGDGDGGAEADAGLRERIARWKAASRLAAEELFELVKERVDGMGGAKAWRESQRRQARGGFWGDEDEVGKKGGFDDEGGERDGDNGEESVREDGGDENEAEEEEGEEESEFTILMMLRSLNIDPDVLGYDAVEGRWLD